jgi:hypothetical protein
MLTGVIILLYLLPAIVAMQRKHPQQVPITIVTIFLGWTLVGWVAALAWASMAFKPLEAR